MGTPLQDVVTGQPIAFAAASVNAWNKAARTQTAPPGPRGTSPKYPTQLGALIEVDVRGDLSGAMCPIAQIQGPAVDVASLTADARPAALINTARNGVPTVIEPDAQGAAGKATTVFMVEPAKIYGTRGKAIVHGFVPLVAVDVSSFTGDTETLPSDRKWAACVEDDHTKLQLNNAGPHRLLYKVNDVIGEGGFSVEGMEWWAVDWNARPHQAAEWYRVQAFEVLVADRKWSYTLRPQRLKGSITLGSSSVMEDDPDGTDLLLAVNVAEDRNTAGSTLQGNDVNFSNAVFGTTAGTLARKLKPIGANHLVQIKGFFNTGAGTEEDPFVQHAMFDAANIVLEPCITE